MEILCFIIILFVLFVVFGVAGWFVEIIGCIFSFLFEGCLKSIGCLFWVIIFILILCCMI